MERSKITFEIQAHNINWVKKCVLGPGLILDPKVVSFNLFLKEPNYLEGVNLYEVNLGLDMPLSSVMNWHKFYETVNDKDVLQFKVDEV